MSESTPHNCEFDLSSAEVAAWVSANGPEMTRWASIAFASRLDAGRRAANADRIDRAIEDIVQLVSIRFVSGPELRARVRANRGYLAQSVRNEVGTWLRRYGRDLLPPRRRGDDASEEPEAVDELAMTTEDLVIDAPEDARRARVLRAVAAVFDDSATVLAELTRLARTHRLLRSRLGDARMRPILDRMLRRPEHSMFCLLIRSGRDDFEGAADEAVELAREFLRADGTWVRLTHDPEQQAKALRSAMRSVQTRRSEWISLLRELFEDHVAPLRGWLRDDLLPDIRPFS